MSAFLECLLTDLVK